MKISAGANVNTFAGFTTQKQLSFRNLSHSPIDYSIRVPSDGRELALTHEVYAKASVKPSFPKSPREFLIDPWDGVLKPGRCLHVQVSLFKYINVKLFTHQETLL